MAIGRGGSSIKTKLGFLLYGQKGTWKSSLALQFLKFKTEEGKQFRVLFIDPETGSVDSYLEQYENEGYDLRNIYIVYTQSISEVNAFINRAKNGDDFYEFDEYGNECSEIYLDSDGQPFRPDAIVVDGVTLLYVAKQQSMMEFSKKRATVRAKKNELVGMEREVAIENANIEIKDYQGLKIDGQNLILNLLASGKHFAITCREEDEKEEAKDKNNEFKRVSTGRKLPSGFKDVGYNCKTVLRLFKDDDGVIKAIVEDKDRSLVHKQDEILIEPTLLDWQAAIDRSKGKKDFVVDNNFDKSVQIEMRAIEKDNAKFDDELNAPDNNTANVILSTAEDYHEAIKAAINKLSATEKSKKQAAVANANLPKAYQKITDISELKTYLSIING